MGESLVSRFWSALPGLIIGLAGAGLAFLFFDEGFVLPFVILLATGGALLLTWVIGARSLGEHPIDAGLILEVAGLAEILAAAAAAGFLIWLLAQAPGEGAAEQTKQLLVAASGAVCAFLGSVFIKPEEQRWHPLPGAIQSRFKGRFANCGDDALCKDAREAVGTSAYGAVAKEHSGQVVSGWGWRARRLRTRHIADALGRSE